MENQIFNLQAPYKPSPDQKKAISQIVNFIEAGHKYQTLWGVTGSGKTFTMANVIEKINKPTLVIAHNKTLAAQLAQEFKEFFPNNAVHYFVSYYDYYQPEAYVSKTDTYIEKEATINEEIDRLRHAATQDLITRRDVIIVASVSCIYGIGDISLYMDLTFDIEVGREYEMENIMKRLINIQYKRSINDFKPGNFRFKGDVLEIFPASSENIYSIEFWGNEVTGIVLKDNLTNEIYEHLTNLTIFPAKHTVTTNDRIKDIIPNIKKELEERLAYFQEIGDVLKYERLKTKVEYDMEMMLEVGYVNGIENYSRFLDSREVGVAPTTLIDYFGDDYLLFVDESHMTFSQIGGMYAGDRSRKENLVENGFRLPSTLDNRPLKFDEFESKLKNVVAVSATPGPYEIGKSCENKLKAKSGKIKGENCHSGEPLFLVLDTGIDSESSKTITHGGNDIIKDPESSLGGQCLIKSGNPERFFNFDPLKDGVWQATEDCRIVPQMMRPTGLLDPEIIIRPMEFMIDDIMNNISEIVEKNERMLITTITKRSSEELTDYLLENGVKVKYLHSEVETLERLEILKELREGKIDVVVGVNLLREGLDLPEVSKICILDADKMGFLRSETSLIQIIGRAARNENGKVYMYSEKLKNFVPCHSELDSESFSNVILGQPERLNQESTLGAGEEELGDRVFKEIDGLYRIDKGKLCNDEGLVVSEAMKKAINLTYYRRNLQAEYNKEHGIIPKTIFSNIKDMGISGKLKAKSGKESDMLFSQYKKGKKNFEKEIKRLEFEMDIAATNLEFERAAELRDMILELKNK